MPKTPGSEVNAALRLRRKRMMVRYLGGKCVDCGYDKSLVALHFHHRDPATKSFNLSVASGVTRPAHEVQAELDKCDLVCATCHAVRHHGIVPIEVEDELVGNGPRTGQYGWVIPVPDGHVPHRR